MRIVIIIAVALAAAFASLASCDVHHRSDEFACTKNTDCPSGRTCSTDGFCVVSGAVDAPKGDAPRTDAGGSNSCPPGCSSCNVAQKTCTINCMQTNCTNTVTCPMGYSCDILCNTDNACRNGVNCQLGTSCSVECSAKSSCQNIQCGPGPCDVACSGVSSCRGVSCSNSCACDVVCTGNQSCTQGIMCSSFGCRSGSGCTSVPLVCHSCN
jgi:hypothetical protein